MIEKLVKALKEDEGYRDVWKANIAMAFLDEYGRCKKKYKNRWDIHAISNAAASNFLDLLVATMAVRFIHDLCQTTEDFSGRR